MTEISRRDFLGGMAAGAAFAVAPGCVGTCCRRCRPGRVALQLYSLKDRVRKLDSNEKVGLAKMLKEVQAIGFEGVEFAGYYGATAAELKTMLDDAGLVVCGTHVDNVKFGFDTRTWTYDPEVLKRTAEFELAYGNELMICPGGGNIPPGCKWSMGRGGEPCTPSAQIDEFTKRLAEFYNLAAADAKKLGVRIGLHNHTWEHGVIMRDGTTFWDYFFSHTDRAVCMEQDVGWSTCAGVDPKEQYRKYPHRSPTLHAKENGMGRGVREFDAILGRPGRPGAEPVDWDGLFPVTDADGVRWYVVECERHFDDPKGAVVPSFEFLKSKGRV